MSKFEYARAVGMLALQLSDSAEDLCDMSPMEAARKMVHERSTALVIRRYLPDGSHEDWQLSSLRIDDDDDEQYSF